MNVDMTEIVTRLVKYVIEGAAVAIAVFLIPSKMKLPLQEVLMIALVAAAAFAVLDLFAPSVGYTARQGAGFGLGAQLVGFPKL